MVLKIDIFKNRQPEDTDQPSTPITELVIGRRGPEVVNTFIWDPTLKKMVAGPTIRGDEDGGDVLGVDNLSGDFPLKQEPKLIGERTLVLLTPDHTITVRRT